MKEKHYFICYEVNLKKLVFTVLVCDSKKKDIYKVIFTRNNMVEKCKDKNFPYIPVFTNLEEFYFWYSRVNSKFSYIKYVIAKILADRILQSSSYEADANWSCTKGIGIIF